MDRDLPTPAIINACDSLRGCLWLGFALSGCGRSQQQAQPQKSLLEQGVQKLETRDYEGAAALFQQYVDQSSNFTVALQEVLPRLHDAP
jgi:outer membrane protein assembly factor BamD (BamD/ComL family)